MNRVLGVMMLLFVLGAEVVGFAQWISPGGDYVENATVAESSPR